jgi:2-keto-4-pentenoate hydratase/2-oxohepta-3-ene-1,7-dioic acid hydratase in catechol pathway
MKILRYESDGKTVYGVLEDDGSIRELVGSPFAQFAVGGQVGQLSDVHVLAPVEPRKIICTGLNYQSHILEMGLPTPEFPILFMKPHTTLVHPEDPIVYPRKGQQVEYEAELTAVIGKPAKNVAEADALDYILGYTCANDVSERVIQSAEMKNGLMLIGKSFDTFCPLGPVIATDLDPANLKLSARLNGETRQEINTSDLLFSVARLVSYVSEAIQLLPGDVILTGTPSGVGPMQPGDVVEIEISGIGVLRNPVIREE